MQPNPLEALESDVSTATRTTARILVDLVDAEIERAGCAMLERAALDHYIAQLRTLLTEAEELEDECRAAVAAARESLLEKADDRRRDAERDAADDRAELAETRTA